MQVHKRRCHKVSTDDYEELETLRHIICAWLETEYGRAAPDYQRIRKAECMRDDIEVALGI